MKKKFYVINILCTLILFSLVGCAETPQEVKDEIAGKSKLESAENTVDSNEDLDFDTIEHIFKTINKVKKENYDNLRFSYEFEINKPDQIGVEKFHQINNFMDRYEEIVKDIIGNNFNKKYLKLDLNSTRPSLAYDDKNKKLFFNMGDNGFFSHEKDIGYNNTLTEVEEISLMQEYEDKSFELSDGIMKISEAVNMAQDYVEQMINRYDNFQWIPNKVIVCKDDKETYLYKICFVKAYKNVYFPTTYSRRDNLKIPYMAMDGTEVIFASKDSPIFFRNNSGIIEYVETIQDYDKIITFECATKLLSNKLSSYKGYEVQYVSLENRLVLKTNLKDSDVIIDPYNFKADNVYESKPCWTFYLDLTPNGEVYAMVDCITGEIEFVDNNL